MMQCDCSPIRATWSAFLSDVDQGVDQGVYLVVSTPSSSSEDHGDNKEIVHIITEDCYLVLTVDHFNGQRDKDYC